MRKELVFLAVTAATIAQARPAAEIRLNQVGYRPASEKVIVVENVNPKGKIVILNQQGETVLTPKVVRKAVSPWSKKKRFIVDASELTEPGVYAVRCGDAAEQLVVRNHPLRELNTAALKLFYLVRSGMPIEERYAGAYAREASHLDTRVLIHPSAASAGRPVGSVISSPGGWYDAGDYNKYVVNSAFSIGLMLSVFEENQDYFNRLRTHIPESGNATPDFLDEMMYNMQWLLTMQDPGDGGVYHKLTTPNFEGFIMPADCRQPRYVVEKTVTATLDFAAVMAQMARIMKGNPDYPAFSVQAAEAARQAYEWAQAHPDAYYRQNELNSRYQPAVNTGAYDDENSRDEWFWASTQLFLLTGEKAYLEKARATRPASFTTPAWGGVSGLGAYAWISAGQTDLCDEMHQQLEAFANQLIARVPSSNFQAPFGDRVDDFGWGCLSEKCCVAALSLLFADRYVQPGKYLDYAWQNADYLLGRNATGYCYVTGFGTKSPMHPHHRISHADQVEAPFPGMLVGGPNPGQQDRGNGNLVYSSDFPDESYVDDMNSYASNEIAINWNASLVAFLSWLDATAE